ncbi:hypothetical protein V3C99_017578 [Haemonchus contortus]|uniref:MitMem_reg domain-containing protein n=1 Tax=Haemonchus contortus TaxID=6289 RepID=A0A7I4Z3X7_HAECO|nr:unnamed protein product [Haemonchus contortus]
MDSRIRNAIRQLKDDDSIPVYVMTLFNYVLDYADQMDAVIGRYKEPEGEVSNLKCDFANMVQSSGVGASILLSTNNVNSDGNLKSVNPSTAVGNAIEKADLSHLIEEKERLRSVVILTIYKALASVCLSVCHEIRYYLKDHLERSGQLWNGSSIGQDQQSTCELSGAPPELGGAMDKFF